MLRYSGCSFCRGRARTTKMSAGDHMIVQMRVQTIRGFSFDWCYALPTPACIAAYCRFSTPEAIGPARLPGRNQASSRITSANRPGCRTFERGLRCQVCCGGVQLLREFRAQFVHFLPFNIWGWVQRSSRASCVPRLLAQRSILATAPMYRCRTWWLHNMPLGCNNASLLESLKIRQQSLVRTLHLGKHKSELHPSLEA